MSVFKVVVSAKSLWNFVRRVVASIGIDISINVSVSRNENINKKVSRKTLARLIITPIEEP